MQKLWILVCVTVLLPLALAQQPARVAKPVVTATLNGEAVLSCDANGLPLSICLLERVGDTNNIITISEGQDKENVDVPDKPGFAYVGNGLLSGQCGIKIKSIRENNNGQWMCKLFTKSSGLRVGVIELEILKKPEPPSFAKSFAPVGEGNTQEVTCLSYNGHPRPSFRWFIGDKEISGENLSPVENGTRDGRTVTYQSLRNYKFTWEDDKKQLRCKTVHDSLTKNDRNEISETIEVTYVPKTTEPKLNVRAPAIGEPITLTYNFNANPRPSVVWNIGKLNVQAGYASPDQRYEAKPVARNGTEGNVYRAELVIKKVQESDLNSVFKVTATNQLGQNVFEIKLLTDAEFDAGLGAGGIVGIVLGISVLIILIVLIVVYTRAKGMLCFKGDDGTSSEKERMGGDGDSNKGGTDEARPPTLTGRLSAMYERLVSKKKDKTAPMDEEAPKEKEANNGDEKKKDDTTVYAELDHARTGTEGNVQPPVISRPKDDVVYSEVGGFLTGQGGEEEKKKTPTGSNNPSPKK